MLIIACVIVAFIFALAFVLSTSAQIVGALARKPCPFCKEQMVKTATACPHCQKEVAP